MLQAALDNQAQGQLEQTEKAMAAVGQEQEPQEKLVVAE